VSVTKNLRDGTLVLSDSGAANSITLACEEGDLRFAESNAVINVLDRGDLSHMRQGDEVPVTLSWTLKFIELISSDTGIPTAYEAIKNIQAASGWTSTNTDGGDVFTLDMVFTISTPTATEKDEIITFANAHGAMEFAEGDEYNTLAFTGEAFIVAPEVAKDAA